MDNKSRLSDNRVMRIYDCFTENGHKACEILNISPETIKRYLSFARARGLVDRNDKRGYWDASSKMTASPSINRRQDYNSKDQEIKDKIKSLLKTGVHTIESLSDNSSLLPKEVRTILDKLREDKFMIDFDEQLGTMTINNSPKIGSHTSLNEDMWKGDILKFGFTSDNHLCSHFERLDVLNLIYDICAGEGVSTVLNGGNWIDGEAQFNKNEIHTKGMTRQIQYAVDNYPYREGINTWFVSGDDHEGWYTQREGINIGDYFQMMRENSGKNDMKHLGYVEADIELNDGGFENNAWMRVMHAGGGSAYATSYSAQKIVESLQGGEKPNILFIGHYHKLLYAYIRNVHTIQMGATQDQSIFMRKKKIEAHVGGGIITLRRAKDGTINRCSVDFITAFDKKFYVGKDKYLKK